MIRGRYGGGGYLEAYKVWNANQLDISPCDVTNTTVTVAGANLGDFAMASLSNSINDTQLEAHVTAANTVTVSVSNVTDTTKNLPSSTLRVRVYPY